MPIEKAELPQGFDLALPRGFTRLNKFANSEVVTDTPTPDNQFRSRNDITIASFAGVVRGVRPVEGYGGGSIRKLTYFINCQETRNNTTGALDFPVTLDSSDFPFDLGNVDIDVGDCLLGLNFGILRENRNATQRYTAVSKWVSQVIVLPRDKHGLQLSVPETLKVLKIYTGSNAKPIDKSCIAEYVHCLKAMRGSQWLAFDDKGENQNELITLDKVARDTKYLNASTKSPCKASMVVEVLWVYNFTGMRNANGELEGRTAMIQVADFSQNPLFGTTQFQTPYCCDFAQTALCIVLWDKMGEPFNNYQFVPGDILQLTNVSFQYVQVQSDNSTRAIEGHIRGTAGTLGENFQPVSSVTEFEQAFLKRRKEYLQKTMHKDPTRWTKGFRSGVPEIQLKPGTDGNKLLKIADDLFYDSYRGDGVHKDTSIKTPASPTTTTTQVKRETPKRPLTEVATNQEPNKLPLDTTPVTKKIRKFEAPKISDLSELSFEALSFINH